LKAQILALANIKLLSSNFPGTNDDLTNQHGSVLERMYLGVVHRSVIAQKLGRAARVLSSVVLSGIEALVEPTPAWQNGGKDVFVKQSEVSCETD
jgi:hypothetical protein